MLGSSSATRAPWVECPSHHRVLGERSGSLLHQQPYCSAIAELPRIARFLLLSDLRGGLCNAVWGAQKRLPIPGLVAFGGGVTATALQMASSAVSWAGVRSAQKELDPQTVSVLREVDTILLVSAWFPLLFSLRLQPWVSDSHTLFPAGWGGQLECWPLDFSG
jgi:hypothetical protein